MTNLYHGLGRLDLLLKECLDQHALNDHDVLPQTFGYLFDRNPITGNLPKETIVDGFNALVDEMKTSEPKNGPADAGQTFFGQFIDHDVTLDATSSIGTRIDPRSIRNVRTPNLDLDCVYGDGPDASPHLYSEKHEGFMLFGREENENDLARNCKGRALIGDPRNDENIVISQIQGAFIQLHNILMTRAENNDDDGHDISQCAGMGVRKVVWDELVPEKLKTFEEVRRFIRLHYQWLVLNDFLPSFVEEAVIDEVRDHDPFHDTGPIMPAEFAVAAYRFGHATVQPSYKLKKKDKDPVDMLDILKGFRPRTADADLEMRMFFDVAGTLAQRALPVGTKMAAALFELPDKIVKGPIDWNGFKISEKRAKKLGLRNILRDRTSIQVVSGQQAARRMRLHPLDPPKALTDHHITKTPLWFYCLQEAQEKGKGRLTGVGGRIVASVIIRLLKLDPESVWHMPDFKPWSGFGEACTMGEVMKFVEDNRDKIAHREDLLCG